MLLSDEFYKELRPQVRQHESELTWSQYLSKNVALRDKEMNTQSFVVRSSKRVLFNIYFDEPINTGTQNKSEDYSNCLVKPLFYFFY